MKDFLDYFGARKYKMNKGYLLRTCRAEAE